MSELYDNKKNQAVTFFMKILALILAREGSKRLLGKNIKNFVKKPLIAWRANIVNLIPKFKIKILKTASEI